MTTTHNEKSPAPEQASEAVHQRPVPKVDTCTADPAAETIVGARVDCSNGTSSKVRSADALTVAAALEAYEKASIAASECEDVGDARVAFVRSIIASAPVERPAAVPIPYDGLTEEFTDEVARLADDAPGIREAVSAALENSNAIIAPQGNAAPAPAGERAALVERVLGMFEAWPKDEPGPTHEPESQYRLGYNTALEDVLTAIDAGAPIRRAASANETDDYETRRKVAEALGIVWPGTRDGKRTGFAWSYLLGCIKDLSSDVRHIYGAYGDACARASANETGAEGAAVAWMRIDDPRDCISDAKKRDMIEHAGAPGARLAENYSIALGKIGPAQAAEPVAWDFRMISRDVPADWHRCASKVHADELRKPDYAGVIEVRDLFDAPQPTGQADAREGLTDEQREAIEYAARWLEENVSNRYAYTAAKQLRALLQGANHAE